MFITTAFDVTVPFLDPLSANEDLENNILKYLRERYEGKCMQNMRISKVVGLDSTMSETTSLLTCISRGTDDGSGDVTVRFTAEACTFETGEVISGCTVSTIRERHGLIHLDHPDAFIVVKNSNNLNSLRPGQKVTCKVTLCQSNPFAEKLSIIATFDLRCKTNYVIKANDTFTPNPASQAMLDKIIEPIQTLRDVEIAVVRQKFFSKFLIVNPIEPVKKNTISLLSPKYTIQAGHYYRFVFGALDPLIEDVTEDVQSGKNTDHAQTMVSYVMIDRFLRLYYNITFAIKSMDEAYPEEDDESNVNLWGVLSVI
jgi:DNA-directed RNA polymerase subunit E'/Rpb7